MLHNGLREDFQKNFAMRRRWIRFVAFSTSLAAVLAMSGVSVAHAFEDSLAQTKKTLLSNGLTILTLEDHSTPVVSFQVWVKAGSRDESRYTGIAHLFEHMMFKGSKHVGPEEHARYIEARGGRINAYTTNDVTVYFSDVTSENLPLVIALEAERIKNLDISEKTLASEREVVLEERRMRTEDNSVGRALEALFATTFLAHPYRWPVIGWQSDVEQVTVQACREFFDTYYAPNNLVIVVVGDFDTQKTVDQIHREFGSLKAREIPRSPTREPVQRGERRAVVYADVASPVFAGAWHVPPSGHPDSPALEVLGQILSAGESSRLFQKLVYQKESALFASGGYWEMQDAGIFYAFAGVRPRVPIAEVENLFFGEMDRMRNELVSEQELEKAKRMIEVESLDVLRTTSKRASFVGEEFVSHGRVRTLAEYLDSIRAVKAEDLQRVAKQYLVERNRSVIHVVADPAPKEEKQSEQADRIETNAALPQRSQWVESEEGR